MIFCACCSHARLIASGALWCFSFHTSFYHDPRVSLHTCLIRRLATLDGLTTHFPSVTSGVDAKARTVCQAGTLRYRATTQQEGTLDIPCMHFLRYTNPSTALWFEASQRGQPGSPSFSLQAVCHSLLRLRLHVCTALLARPRDPNHHDRLTLANSIP